MLQSFYNANKQLLNKLIFIFAFISIIYLFVNYLFYYIAPFVFGYILSLILVPFVNYFDNKYKINRGVSTAIFLVIVIILLIILGTNLVTKVVYEIKSLSEDFPIYVAQFKSTINNIKQNYHDFLAFIPNEISTILESLSATFTVGMATALSTIVKNSSFHFVSKIPNFFMATILCIIYIFFFNKYKKLIHLAVRNATPIWLSDGYRTIKSALINAIWGYTKAQLILMTVTATICIIGLSVIKFPYALLVGLCTSLIDALPIFGAGFILWPLALINVIYGNYSTSIGIMIVYLIVIITRQFLEPKVLGSQIGIHPLLTLMSIYIGLRIFGVLGFIIGPMVLVVSKVILEQSDNKQTRTY